MEALNQLMDLLGMELAHLAGLYQLGRVVECRGLVEPVAEPLPHQGARQRVMPTIPAVYVSHGLAVTGWDCHVQLLLFERVLSNLKTTCFYLRGHCVNVGCVHLNHAKVRCRLIMRFTP